MVSWSDIKELPIKTYGWNSQKRKRKEKSNTLPVKREGFINQSKISMQSSSSSCFFFFKIKKYTKHNTQEKQGKLQHDAVPSVDQNNQYFILYCLYLNC